MDILQKLFSSPEASADQKAQAVVNSYNQPRLTASEKYHLAQGNLQGMDPNAYLAYANPTNPPQGESLAYINDAEKKILKNAGASGKMTPSGIPSYEPEDPLRQAAALLNSEAPEGEGLAYINSEEADVLKGLGGAGIPVNSSGIPSFFVLEYIVGKKAKDFFKGEEAPELKDFDFGKSAREYIDAMADPSLQDKLLQIRQTYDPQYQDLRLNLARRAADPMAQLTEDAAMRSQDFGARMAERQAESDISMMGRFGADMNEAYRASDPLMQTRTQQANMLADQAFNEAQMTDLSPEQRRRATQSAREGLVARGRGMDNAGIAAEAMSREDYLRKIIGESRDDAMKFGGYASNLNRQTSVDPLAMLRGGSNYTAQGFGERSALFGMPQESATRINPDAGVNIGMQGYANRANFDQANYAAQEQARTAMITGLMNMIGQAGGQAASMASAGACWVAREVYGENNPAWLLFRRWMLNESPSWFRSAYLKFGEKFALFIKNKPRLKAIIRQWMDTKIGR
jgi:hypothetical protein